MTNTPRDYTPDYAADDDDLEPSNLWLAQNDYDDEDTDDQETEEENDE